MSKKHWILLMLLVFGYVLRRYSDVQLSLSFASTFYTVASIMFSIGMGVVCTFNYDRIKNPSLLRSAQRRINKVRDIYLVLFSILTIGFLILQILPTSITQEAHKLLALTANYLPVFWTLFTIYCIAYFIINLIRIQALNFEIASQISKE